MICPGHTVRKWLATHSILLRRLLGWFIRHIPLLSPARVLVAAETPKKFPGAKSRGPTSMQTKSRSLGVFKDTLGALKEVSTLQMPPPPLLVAGKIILKSEYLDPRQPQDLVSEWHGAVCTPGLMLALTGMCFGPVRILCREEDPCMCCPYVPGALHGVRYKSAEAMNNRLHSIFVALSPVICTPCICRTFKSKRGRV